jgi:hypothetical protein
VAASHLSATASGRSLSGTSKAKSMFFQCTELRKVSCDESPTCDSEATFDRNPLRQPRRPDCLSLSIRGERYERGHDAH